MVLGILCVYSGRASSGGCCWLWDSCLRVQQVIVAVVAERGGCPDFEVPGIAWWTRDLGLEGIGFSGQGGKFKGQKLQALGFG